MSKLVQLAICLLIVRVQSIVSQCLRGIPPPQYVIDGPRQLEISNLPPPLPYYSSPFVEPPAPRQTTVITDCTPEVCKNLVNTIQLLIVSNLLKNTKKCPSDAAIKLASPVIKEVLSSVQNNPGLLSNSGLLGTGVNPGVLLSSLQNEQALLSNGLIGSGINPGLLNTALISGTNNINPGLQNSGLIGNNALNNLNSRLIANSILSGSSCPCSNNLNNNLGNQGLSQNIINLLNNLDNF